MPRAQASCSFPSLFFPPSLALPLSLLFSSRIGNELVLLLSLSPLDELVMSLADQERERLSRLAVRGLGLHE